MQRNITNTVIAIFNDEHSGSAVAPFPLGQWQFRSMNVSANDLQRVLYEQYREFSIKVGERRKGKRLIVVKLGDCVDGLHHMTPELVSQYIGEMVGINCHMTEVALADMAFDKDAGDLLYFVAGTPVHAGEAEEQIAKDFEDYIQPYNESRRVWPVLHMDVNGKYLFFAHHGPAGGKGRNKGNGLRNRLKMIWDEYRDANKRVPDLACFADKHKKTYEILTINGEPKMQGVISPAWQAKTDFVYKIAAEDLVNVGGTVFEITAEGIISPPEFITLEVEQDPMVYV